MAGALGSTVCARYKTQVLPWPTPAGLNNAPLSNHYGLLTAVIVNNITPVMTSQISHSPVG